MSSRGRGRGRPSPAKTSLSRTPTGRGSRRRTSDERTPGTEVSAYVKPEVTQTAIGEAQQEMKPPRRPGFGTKGRSIALRTNRFSVNVAIETIHHYDVKFDPEPRKAKYNVKIVEMLTETFSQELAGARPAYDGKANLFTAKLLPFPNREVGCVVDREEESTWSFQVFLCRGSSVSR